MANLSFTKQKSLNSRHFDPKIDSRNGGYGAFGDFALV